MFKITGIDVLINAVGIDKVFLYTNLPPTFPEVVSMENMQMTIDLQKGTAIEYLKKHFGNNPDFPATATVIDGKTGIKTIVKI